MNIDSSSAQKRINELVEESHEEMIPHHEAERQENGTSRFNQQTLSFPVMTKENASIGTPE